MEFVQSALNVLALSVLEKRGPLHGYAGRSVGKSLGNYVVSFLSLTLPSLPTWCSSAS
jgi:hypothetical protein